MSVKLITRRKTADPVLYDGLIVAATFDSVVPKRKVQRFADEIFNHYKALGYASTEILDKDYANAPGVAAGISEFVEALKKVVTLTGKMLRVEFSGI